MIKSSALREAERLMEGTRAWALRRKAVMDAGDICFCRSRGDIVYGAPDTGRFSIKAHVVKRLDEIIDQHINALREYGIDFDEDM